MPIVVETLENAGMVTMIRLGRRLWLTEDKKKIVEDGDPSAAFLYGSVGQLVPKAETAKLGAIQPDKATTTKQAPKPANKQAPPPADKSATVPAEETK